MSDTFYLAYEFIKAIVQKRVAIADATSATDTITTAAAHGLVVGETIGFSDIGTIGGGAVAVGTRYFITAVPSTTTLKVAATRGGSAISLGTATGIDLIALDEIEIAWPNQAATQADNQQYTWEGGGDRKQLSLLRGLTLTFSSAAIPAEAHAEIFGKTAITGALPNGMTNARGYGGGNDKGGVTCGLILQGYAIKNVAGVETTVNFARWFPQGNLTFTNPAGQQTGQAAGTSGYSFTASRVSVDLVGAAITGASSGGEFFFDGEIP